MILRKNMFFCHPKKSCLCKPLVCAPSRTDRCMYSHISMYLCIYVYIYIYNLWISVVVIFFLLCLIQMALTWKTCQYWGGRRKTALCLKQQFSALESWSWILLLRGVPTRCQPCDVGCFSQLVVKTHLHCQLLSWTCRAASILPHKCLQQANTVLPGTSI